MAEVAVAAKEPLLNNGVQEGSTKGTPLLSSLGSVLLKSSIWIVFVTWVAAIFFFPTEVGESLLSKWITLTRTPVFDITGSLFLGFSGPVLVMALLAYICVGAFQQEPSQKGKKFPSFRLWTFPVLVDGPFGVVSAAEFIGIILFFGYLVWTIVVYAMQSQSVPSEFLEPGVAKSYKILEITGLRFGSMGLFCLIFLFLPISRGSILLRLIDIPFEHATRYHVWLGHLTMTLFTLHGFFYVLAWALEGRLVEKILEWKDIGVANLPGVISLLSGLLMWVTSLHKVRKNYFELFFYTHQLYVVFIVFLALHVGDFIFSIAAGAIFLFMLDRFLRFCQSRNSVDILSATCRPCGTVEIVFSKPANLRYNALSFVFVQVRELSWLQWHPFSVSSSPLDGKYHLSILIKVLGEWTDKLRELITNNPKETHKNFSSQPRRITASIEGPYGHEVPYHLMYENLILVAGGIGISPFLAIISDICHRIIEGKPCLPKNVMVIWAVKKSNELSLLSVLDEQFRCSSFSSKLHLDIQAYVTQESEPSLEEGKIDDRIMPPSLSVIHGSRMSCLVGTGDNLWCAAYFVVSTFSFIVLFGLVEIYYIQPFGVTSWWYRGLLFTLCMVAGVVVLGGVVILLWHLSEKRISSQTKQIKDDGKADFPRSTEQVPDNETLKENFSSLQTTKYGCRPDFRESFSSFGESAGHVDVGVIVCGPPGLQTSVAKACRSLNIGGRWNHPVFHFNSHSFDL